MTVILHYFTEFSSFRGALHKSGWRYTYTFGIEMYPQRI